MGGIKLINKYSIRIIIFLVFTLFYFSLTGCGNNDEPTTYYDENGTVLIGDDDYLESLDSDTADENFTDEAINDNSDVNIIEEVVPTEIIQSQYDIDLDFRPVLTGTTNGETVGSVELYSLYDFTITLEESDYTTNSEALPFEIKEVKDDAEITKKDIGDYTIYNTSKGVFFCNQGDDISKAFGLFSAPYNIFDNAFANSNGSIFFLGYGYLYCMVGENLLEKVDLSGDSQKLSENKKYLAWSYVEYTDGPNLRHYCLYNFETSDITYYTISDEECITPEFNTSNYIIGNNGEIVIGDGLKAEGIVDSWNSNASSNIFISAEGLTSIYRANFTGYPLFVNDNYIVYTEQYKLMKADDDGNSILYEYINLEDPLYQIVPIGQFDIGIDAYCCESKIMFTDAPLGLIQSRVREIINTFDCNSLEFIDYKIEGND
jgi:hypothetical protein